MSIQFGLALKNFVGPNETPDIDRIIQFAERATGGTPQRLYRLIEDAAEA